MMRPKVGRVAGRHDSGRGRAAGGTEPRDRNKRPWWKRRHDQLFKMDQRGMVTGLQHRLCLKREGLLGQKNEGPLSRVTF